MSGIFPPSDQGGKPPSGNVCNGFSPAHNVIGMINGVPLYFGNDCATTLPDCVQNSILSELLAAVDIGLDVPWNSQRIDNLGRALRDKFVAIAADIADVESKKVDRAGDTMTGPLVLPADPTQQAEASTKNYVDLRELALNADLRNHIDTVAAAITAAFQAADAIIDQRKINRDGDTMTGPLVAAADPAQPLEVATKAYVDNLIGAVGPSTGAQVVINSVPPPSPVQGELWWDTVSGQLFVRYLAQWVQANGVAQ